MSGGDGVVNLVMAERVGAKQGAKRASPSRVLEDTTRARDRFCRSQCSEASLCRQPSASGPVTRAHSCRWRL